MFFLRNTLYYLLNSNGSHTLQSSHFSTVDDAYKYTIHISLLYLKISTLYFLKKFCS